MSRRGFMGSLLGALSATACGARGAAIAQRDYEVIDLSHTLTPSSPYIHVPGATFPFRRAPIATIPTRGVYANRWELTEHIGTHVDAPCHFDERAPCLDAIPLENLFAEAVVVDLTERARTDPDTELTAADLDAWEAAQGALPARCAVILRSGWDARWPSQARFANADAAGVMHFPGFSRAAIERLAASPKVLGIGTDTFSVDPGRDARYQGHRELSTAGKWALECLANLSRLPPRGARIFIGAPKVELASGGPARVIAWVPLPRRAGSV
ncbi:MAG: cyclase family protein [Myxococcales bacterium]|nr:cyclase family protein [Myxococcales bacterium]